MGNELDVSLLVEKTDCGYAVNCVTKGEAIEFIDYIRANYPDKCRGWLHGEYNYKFGSDTVYTFDFDIGSGCKNGSLMYGDLGECIKGGYKILAFEDICKSAEIEPGDKDLDFLLGGAT